MEERVKSIIKKIIYKLFSKEYKDLYKELKDFDYISFDIFDTLKEMLKIQVIYLNLYQRDMEKI